MDEVSWVSQGLNCVFCDWPIEYTFPKIGGTDSDFPAKLTIDRRYDNEYDIERNENFKNCPRISIWQTLSFDILDHSVGAVNAFDPASVRYGTTYRLDYILDTTANNSFEILRHVIGNDDYTYFMGTLDFTMVKMDDSTQVIRIQDAEFSIAFEKN